MKLTNLPENVRALVKQRAEITHAACLELGDRHLEWLRLHGLRQDAQIRLATNEPKAAEDQDAALQVAGAKIQIEKLTPLIEAQHESVSEYMKQCSRTLRVHNAVAFDAVASALKELIHADIDAALTPYYTDPSERRYITNRSAAVRMANSWAMRGAPHMQAGPETMMSALQKEWEFLFKILTGEYQLEIDLTPKPGETPAQPPPDEATETDRLEPDEESKPEENLSPS